MKSFSTAKATKTLVLIIAVAFILYFLPQIYMEIECYFFGIMDTSEYHGVNPCNLGFL